MNKIKEIEKLYPKKRLKKNLILFIFIFGLFFGLIFIPNNEGNSNTYAIINDIGNISENPSSSDAYMENRTTYSKEMVKDPNFDLEQSSSPWSEDEDGDISDIDENLDNNQANYDVVGETHTFTDLNGVPQSGWQNQTNPDFPAFPEWPEGGSDAYGIDGNGCWASHAWEEGPKQTPSIQWHKNFTMPVNMSDYTITSANVSAKINATVDQNIDVIDVRDDPYGDPDYSYLDQGVLYDYIRFYVSIADPLLENIYEIAYYQTYELGLFVNATYNILEIEKNMSMILEDNLLFYLTQVLSQDHENFTVILGMNIFSEDNCHTDWDYWNMTRIKDVDFTFTYEKKIDQLTSASWNQTGNIIDNGEYELGVDDYFIINNASLNFDYNISQEWPSLSLNSEFRIFLNDYQIPNTIKLTNFSISPQNQIFDISPSLINASENITIKIQLYIADNFQLSNNITVSIDNVNLTTHFTVVERKYPISTTLETTTGYLSRSVPWNESFVVSLNYTNASDQVGISGSDFIVEWSDSYEIQEVANGIYNISCNNTLDVSSLPYSLKISVNITDTWYESKTLELKFYVVGLETNLQILLGDEDVSSSDKIEVPISSQLNFTLFYYDSGLSELLQNSQMSLDGLDSSSYSSTLTSTSYNFLINTSKLGLGLHIASFLTEKSNYESISKNFQISIRQIHTNITTINANQSYTIETGKDFDLFLFIADDDFGRNLSGCEVSYSSSFSSGVINETDPGTYSVSFDEVPQGIYTIYITVFKGSDYNFKQFEITLNVITPPTDGGIPDFVFYLMGVLMVGLIASFIAYQQHFKYPKIIREIRGLRKAIKKGKAAEKMLSVKVADEIFVEDYISKTKGTLHSKNKALLKDHSAPAKSMAKSDVKKGISGEKPKIKETQKKTPEIPKEVKKPDISRKPSRLEESLELPKAEQPKKVEPTQKIEKIKPDQFVKPHNIEESDLKQISADQKPKKIRYLRKPKIKELPKKTPKKPKKD